MDHPTYANPLIQEALCEIHFCLPEGVEWKPTLTGELFKHIQGDFPELEPVPQIGMELVVGQGNIGQTISPPRQRMRYKHASRNLLLQLSENIFTVNVLPTYPGWEQMSRDVLDTWDRTRQVIKPQAITRIGLRYINRIKRTAPNETPGDWLTTNDFVPKAVLSSLPGFLSRLVVHPDPQHRVVITLGESPDTSELAPPAIILDIDCILEKRMEIDDTTITTEIAKLHDMVWSIFSASITTRLEQLLQGGER